MVQEIVSLPGESIKTRNGSEDVSTPATRSTAVGDKTTLSSLSALTWHSDEDESNFPGGRSPPVSPTNLYYEKLMMESSEDGLSTYEIDVDKESSRREKQRHRRWLHGGKDFTLRAIAVGLLVGVLLCFTNMYFGLQSGWVTMGAIQAAVMGYGFCRLISPKDLPLSREENVVLQTVSIATATMPLTGGFVGIIPALEMLDPPVVLDWSQQLLWCGALTYFGVFVAVPLRHQTILVEKLPFPSGTAAAKIIEFLHSEDSEASESMSARWLSLSISFGVSFLLALVSFIWTSFSNLAVCTWIGLPVLSQWHWTFRPTLSYVGQGIIMGPRAVFSMLFGAVIAWAILGPTARAIGWATGPVDSWKDGAQGWLLWVAIGLMLGEAVSFAMLSLYKELSTMSSRAKLAETTHLNCEADNEDIPVSWWVCGAFASLVVSTAITSPLFAIPSWQIVLAVLVSCIPAVVAVRALGQTDLNPVSGVGKLSQVFFAVVAPGHMVTNIVAGAVVEASAQQAGDLMQAFKTGELLKCSPRHQFYATLVGSTGSVFVTVGAFQLYRHIYGIPSAEFQAPVAHIWLKMAYLMKEGIHALPASALYCAAIAFCLGGALPVLEHAGVVNEHESRHFLPSGVAMGIGMYLTPDWTLPRVWGAIAAIIWRHAHAKSYNDHHIMVASGFVIGEVAMSLIGLFVKVLVG